MQAKKCIATLVAAANVMSIGTISSFALKTGDIVQSPYGPAVYVKPYAPESQMLDGQESLDVTDGYTVTNNPNKPSVAGNVNINKTIIIGGFKAKTYNLDLSSLGGGTDNDDNMVHISIVPTGTAKYTFAMSDSTGAQIFSDVASSDSKNIDVGTLNPSRRYTVTIQNNLATDTTFRVNMSSFRK
jgi:hypothetical protein